MPVDDRSEAIRVLARLSRLVERSTGDLSLAHYRVLAAVADGDERASRVATRLALGKPTISASVDALCRRGLLVRDAVATDQRATALRLTLAGKAALNEVETTLLTRFEALLAHTADPNTILVALGQLSSGLDALADEHLAALRQGDAR
jgi:DNA-binding MarR family transcriptional regulator